MTAPSNANTSGLSEIISDDEILRVHGHANFGPQMTPREVVNEGVLKYAFGYHSGHTQLCILMAHGLITKPRPGSYDASLTKKGKRYARALGGYQNAVTAASAQARIDAAEARADRLAKFGQHTNWELSHGHPDGEEEDGCWLVHSVNGGRNDREWTLIGRGETPDDAIRAALQQETQP